ncbi:hypothetical protein F7725_002391 [Dissostichus mawsoni]|uniref:Uncharacterized protein n=1 Tax=Dissostichus mawsoni TaxID=36200 RepID=A0A7J5Y281_DISMA|nr:hypothetical protein F7725_002391 [Dissostichus mawsoni]
MKQPLSNPAGLAPAQVGGHVRAVIHELIRTTLEVLLLVEGIGDAPHAHEPLAAHAHVPEVPVLSGPHVHHLASEVGLIVHQPVTVHHVAGLAVGHAVTLLDVVAIVHQLVTLTTEVLLLVNLHPELASVLLLERIKTVGTVVDHEAAALHPAGVTPAQVGGHVRAVALALMGTTLEVPLLVENDLKKESMIRLMLMNLWPLMPISLKLLYSPGLMYIILPLKLGCSYISQFPSITLQDMQSDML